MSFQATQKLLLIIMLCMVGFSVVNGQDFSNKGKDFWVGYGSHVSMYTGTGIPNTTGGPQDLVLYFTSDHDATVTVEIPSVGYLKTYPVKANTVTVSDAIPKTGTQDSRITAEGKSDKGIHITSDYAIIAYAHIYNNSISGASLLFPTNTLGRSYYSINYKQESNSPFSYCYAYVIATEDSTNVEIILSANTEGGFKKGDTIKVALNKGQIYNVFGKVLSTSSNASTGEDLTGTQIRSVATATSTCKRIAVFSGSGKIGIYNNNSKTADNYIQQAFPANAWGKKYLTVPTAKMTNNIYRVAVSDPAAVVKLNGVAFPSSSLVNNFYYEFVSNAANAIESDLPIMVAQYITTTGSYGNINNNNGDPEMIYLSPIEQTINKVTINSTPFANIVDTLHYVNIVLPKGATASLKVDGVTPTNFFPHPGDANYVYYQVNLRSGSHTIAADSGFNAIAYGYGSVETYGYNAGTNVIDLYQKLTVNNQFGTVKLPATCRGTPFKASITLPYQPLSLVWSIPKYPNIPPNYAPVYDSTYVVNGKTIYRYTLNQYLTYDSIGNYNFQIKVYNPTGDGCSGEQVIDFELVVYKPPAANFTLKSAHCLGDSLYLSDNSLIGPNDRNLIAYNWKVGTAPFVNAKNYVSKSTIAGTIPIQYFVITDIGCLSDTLLTEVKIDSIPSDNFILQQIKCIGRDMLFTDSSFAKSGTTISKWIWNYGDGKVDTLNTNSPVHHTYDTAKNYSVRLTLQTTNGCSVYASKSFNVNPNPLVGFMLPKICLRDAYAEFTDTTSIADRTNNFKYAWNFGEPLNTLSPNTSTDQNPRHRYLNPGTYQVNEKVTSVNGCAADTTLSFTVNGSFPKSNFSIIDSAALCSNLPVQLNNTSTVDIGSIGKIVIYWDYANNPLDTTIDNSPTINKVYKHNFSNFHFPDKMKYNIKLVSFSGGTCSDEKMDSINIVPPPQSFNVASSKDYICVNDSISFTPNITGGTPSFSYQWSVDNTAAIFKNNILAGNSKGTVKVSVKVKDAKQCLYNYDLVKTIEVRDLPISKIQARDTNICNEDPIVLTAQTSSQYNWYLNNTLFTSTIVDTLSTFKPGYYKVKVNDGFCSSLFSDSLQIYQYIIPRFSFSNTKYICVNSPVRIVMNDIIPKGTHFLWNFGDTTSSTSLNPQTHNYNKKGGYKIDLTYTNDYCPKYNGNVKGDSILVVDPLKGGNYSMFVLLGVDTLLTNIKLDSGYTSYVWSPGIYLSNPSIANPIFNGMQTTDYLLTRTDTASNCQIVDNYHIVVTGDVLVVIPKAFTPNRDGLNDVLKIEYGVGVKTFNYIKIFNRWGNIVYESNNVNASWDGRYNGRDQDMDAYTYLIDYITFKNEHISKTGSVILIR
jgi:gliding motility-associated-like protein